MARSLIKSSHSSQLPKTYEPLHIVLSEIEFLHKELRRIIRDIAAGDQSDPRSEYLHHYWNTLEKKRVKAIKDYCQDGDKKFLATWVQYIPIDDLIETLRDLEVLGRKSFDDLMACLTCFNQALVEFYRKMSRSSSADRVESLFSDLAVQTEREAVQLSWRMRDE